MNGGIKESTLESGNEIRDDYDQAGVQLRSGEKMKEVSAVICNERKFVFGNPLNQFPVGLAAPEITRLSMLAVAVIGTAILTGLLRKRLVDTLIGERHHHATSERLWAALDQVDIGIVLLDSDTRAEFINRAFRQYFALSDEKADSKPPFIALMYHGRDTGAYEMPEDELSTFIAQRTEMMRVGDSTPININLSDGQVLRFSCTALPDGGRMLSYTPVTELVRRTDDPAYAEYYRLMRKNTLRGPFQNLRAAE